MARAQDRGCGYEEPQEDMERQEYLDERKLLIEGEHRVAERLDNALVWLSGSALALSITFASQISPNPGKSTSWLLAGAWAAFGFGVVLTLGSMYASQYAYGRQRKILDARYLAQVGNGSEGGTDTEKTNDNRARTWVNWLTGSGFGCFVIGLLCLVMVMCLNLLDP